MIVDGVAVYEGSPASPIDVLNKCQKEVPQEDVSSPRANRDTHVTAGNKRLVLGAVEEPNEGQYHPPGHSAHAQP